MQHVHINKIDRLTDPPTTTLDPLLMALVKFNFFSFLISHLYSSYSWFVVQQVQHWFPYMNTFYKCHAVIKIMLQRETHVSLEVSCVMRKCTLRSLSLSYQKKDWRGGGATKEYNLLRQYSNIL